MAKEVTRCTMESKDGGKTWQIVEVEDVRILDRGIEKVYISRPYPYQDLVLKGID
jgi:hypothetical protein